jgi:hypothetical protein
MDRVKSSLQTELQWQTRVNLFISITSLSSLYLYGILRWTTTRQPYFRLVLTSPVLLVNAWLPLLFDTYDELLTRGSITYLAAWMCTFKVCACMPTILLPSVRTGWPQLATIEALECAKNIHNCISCVYQHSYTTFHHPQALVASCMSHISSGSIACSSVQDCCS